MKMCSKLSSASKIILLALGLDSPEVLATPVNPQPTGGTVISGQAGINQLNPNTVQINQSSQKAIIQWQTFDVAKGEKVAFETPDKEAITLNRVMGRNASDIEGNLTSNGQLWIINPNGVLFGKGAEVNTAGLLASTLDITNDNFNKGHYQFESTTNDVATILNEGDITSNAGYVAMLAPEINNSGIVSAQLGTVAMAAGTEATLTFAGNQLLNIAVPAGAKVPMVDDNGNPVAALSNSGVINANGGQVLLNAQSVNTLLDNSINVSGVIKADTVGEAHGKIILTAGGSTILDNAQISAQGLKTGEKGGSVEVLGKNVGLFDSTNINASGAAGGGQIHVGWDKDDLNAVEAQDAIIDSNVILNANAMQQGSGGFIETSGEVLDENSANISMFGASGGKNGTWLLDPYNLTISTSADSNLSNPSGHTFSPSGGTSNLNVTTLTSALNTGDVLVETGGDAGVGNGNITIANNAEIAYNSINSLTLNAYGNVEIGNTSDPINHPIIDNGGTGSITIKAGYGAGTPGTSGTITLDSGAAIYFNGSVSLLSKGLISQLGITSSNYIDVNGLTIDAGGGNVDLQGINRVKTLTITNAGTVNFVDSNETSFTSRPDLTIAGIDATGNVSVTENSAYNPAGAIFVNGTINSNNHQVTLDDTNNTIVENGAGNIVTGTANLTASGNIDLEALNNSFGYATVSAGDALTLVDGNVDGVEMQGTSGGAFSVTSAGLMTLFGSVNANSLNLISTAGINQSVGSIYSSGSVTLDSGNNQAISLTDLANHFGSGVTLGSTGETVGDVSLGADSSGIALTQNATSLNSLTVNTHGGAVTQSTALDVLYGMTIDTTNGAGAHDITLATTGNNFHDQALSLTGENISVTDSNSAMNIGLLRSEGTGNTTLTANSINLLGGIAANTATLTAQSGSITDNSGAGSIVAGTTNLTAKGGAGYINLENTAANSFGTLTASAEGTDGNGHGITLNDNNSSGLTIAGLSSTLDGNVSVVERGAVTSGSAITITGAIDASGGAVALSALNGGGITESGVGSIATTYSTLLQAIGGGNGYIDLGGNNSFSAVQVLTDGAW